MRTNRESRVLNPRLKTVLFYEQASNQARQLFNSEYIWAWVCFDHNIVQSMPKRHWQTINCLFFTNNLHTIRTQCCVLVCIESGEKKRRPKFRSIDCGNKIAIKFSILATIAMSFHCWVTCMHASVLSCEIESEENRHWCMSVFNCII